MLVVLDTAANGGICGVGVGVGGGKILVELWTRKLEIWRCDGGSTIEMRK